MNILNKLGFLIRLVSVTQAVCVESSLSSLNLIWSDTDLMEVGPYMSLVLPNKSCTLFEEVLALLPAIIPKFTKSSSKIYSLIILSKLFQHPPPALR